MRTSEEIKTEIKTKFGFIPTWLNSVQETPAMFDHLWQQTAFAYVNNPLPALFKEQLLAYLSRFCSANYCLIAHSCALRPMGMSGREILILLTAPLPDVSEMVSHVKALKAEGEPIQDWPKPQSVLETALFNCTALMYIKPRIAKEYQTEMKRILKPINYNHLMAFLAYVKMYHLWAETHPDLAYAEDERIQKHLAPLLQEAPELDDFFQNYNEQIVAELQSYESQLIAERAQAQSEARQELEQQRDQFLSIASHELRTPLTSIKGFAQVLQRNLIRTQEANQSETANPAENTTAPPKTFVGLSLERQTRVLGNIIFQANRLINLIEEMLDISRIHGGQLKLRYSNVDMVKLVQRIVEQQQDIAINRQIGFESRRPVIKGKMDEARIEQVVSNLLNNALKYSPVGTPVTIGVEYEIPLASQEKSGPRNILVWVRDVGWGISPTQQLRIFEQYYRVRSADDPNTEGLGLGLYISHEIVARHGGRLWLESKPGEGSTFYFTLPIE